MTDSCSKESKALLSVTEALSHLEQAITSIAEAETIDLNVALGRILAKAVFSPVNLPFERNAAMDGYAFSSRDISPDSFTLTLIGTSWAGEPFKGQLHPGQCIRIFTGAVLPESADSVIMQEHVQNEGQEIIFPAGIKAFQNVREMGEDLPLGGILCGQSRKLTAQDLGLLASAGIKEISVVRQLKIAVFSTGNELTPLGQALTTGKLYDSNRYLLGGLLADTCYQLIDSGVLVDSKKCIEDSFMQAAKQADVIITTGGASVGDADYVKQVLASCGKLDFWKCAIKPGKPLVFGKIYNCYFFGLPGNPVSALVTFQQFLAPALRKLSGTSFSMPFRLKAVSTSKLKKSQGRTEFQRGILSQNENLDLFVSSSGHQGSHIQSSSSSANCFIVLPPECLGVEIGDTVCVEPFSIFL